jgi:hypothetical protein
MKKLSISLALILFLAPGIAGATEYITRMIDVSISKDGDPVMNEMVRAFDKVPVSLEKIGSDHGFSNQFSFLITSEAQANGLIKTEVYTKIINHTDYETVTTAPKDVAKVFLLTAEKPAQFRIGPYLVRLVIKAEMVADAVGLVAADVVQ